MGKRVGNIIFMSLLLFFFSSAIQAVNHAAASDGQRYAIEAGLYLQKRSAEQMVSDLQQKGYEPYLLEKSENGRQFYLVLLGSYPSQKEAEEAASGFTEKENLPAIAVMVEAQETAAATEKSDETAAAPEPVAGEDIPLQVETPSDQPLPATTLTEITPAGADAAPGDIENMVEGWLQAWSSKDISEYGNYYAEGFAAKGMNRKQWLQYKDRLNRKYDYIQVQADDLKVYPGQDRMVVQFRQHYDSSGLKEVGYKQLILTREDGEWKIFREIWSETNTFDLPPGFEPRDAASGDDNKTSAAKENVEIAPAVAAASGAAENMRYSVQVGSFLKKSVAEQVSTDLKAKGYEPYVLQLTDFSGKTYFAVRMHDSATQDEAAQAAARFAENEGLPAIVVPFDSLESTGTEASTSEASTSAQAGPVTEEPLQGTSVAATASPKLFSVQLIPYASRTEAEAMSAELADKGYQPYIFEAPGSGGQPFYAVRIGDYQDQESALSALTDFKQAEKLPAFLTAINSINAMKIDPAVARQFAPAVPTAASLNTGHSSGQTTPAPSRTPMLVKNKNGEIVAADDLVSQLEILKAEVEKIQGENEVRKNLLMTEEEEEAKEAEILEAAGREYTLMRKGSVGLEYNLTYQYNSYDIIKTEEEKLENVDHQYNHSLTNSIIAEYAVLDNLTTYVNLPFEYRYYKVGTDGSLDETNLGDISLGVQWQPFKSGQDIPATILTASVSLPTGESPFEIVADEELGTGSGFYSASAGLSLSKVYDPIIAFGSLNYTYNFDADDLDQYRNGAILDEFDPGDEISTSLGFGLALSYNISMTMSYQYTFTFEDEYVFRNADNVETEARASSMLFLGAGWRFTPKHSIYLKVGVGLTNEDPDFTFSFRLPYEF